MENERLLVDKKTVAWLNCHMDEIRAEIHKEHGDSDLFLTGTAAGIEIALTVLDLPKEAKS